MAVFGESASAATSASATGGGSLRWCGDHARRRLRESPPLAEALFVHARLAVRLCPALLTAPLPVTEGAEGGVDGRPPTLMSQIVYGAVWYLTLGVQVLASQNSLTT